VGIGPKAAPTLEAGICHYIGPPRQTRNTLTFKNLSPATFRVNFVVGARPGTKFQAARAARILAQRNMHNSHPSGGLGRDPAAR
jgi:hypothetical protein